MMDPLEQELREALQRVDPPDGFAERVMARIQRRRAAPRWLAAAAALLIAAGALEYYRYQRGEQAKEKVLLGLRISAEKLHYVQVRIQQEER